MNKIITLGFSILFVFTHLFSQGKLDYENDSRWFWGLNTGTTWQTTDVKNKNNWGAGLVIGRSLNYDYGKKISFDIRGRYLYGLWSGQNIDTTGFALPNHTLSSGNTNYKDNLGYSILNFQTKVHRLALELVIHANGIRERTSWDPYIFGGVGLSFSRTMGNLLYNDPVNGEQMYQYDQLLGNLSKSTVKGFQDKTYETALDGSSKGAFNVGFMPSVGIGIGYQVSKRFSLGLEHKTTFTRVDNFDGYVDPKGTFKNDIYHYTSFYLRFQIKKHTPRTKDNSLGNVPVYEQVKPKPPVVSFQDPAVSPTTVYTNTYNIAATVLNVDQSNQVRMEVNGQNYGNFNFNSTTKRVNAPITLNYGSNIVTITGTNAVGSDSKTILINYERPPMEKPPVVYFEDPATNPYTTSATTFSLSAKALNVSGEQNIVFKQNGSINKNFTFNSTTKEFRSNVVLNPGNNIFEIVGSNNAGSDLATTVIVNQRTTAQPPIVSITNPPVTPYNTENPILTLNAYVYNVTSSNQISIWHNGNVISNFNFYNYDQSVSTNLNLKEGTNTIIVQGKNNAGTDQKQVVIIYRKPFTEQPPLVTFVNPAANNTSTENPLYSIAATVANVRSADNVTVNVNGIAIRNFNFNAATTNLNFNMNLVEGANVITITGTNTVGSDSKTRTIYYRKAASIPLPVVTFQDPAESPLTVYTTNYNVRARVQNVANAQNITLKINGVNSNNFNFSNSSEIMTFSTGLINGANLIEITGTNTAGSDVETTTIIYKRQDMMQPPVVNITSPDQNPHTVTTASVVIKANILNVENPDNITVTVNGNNFRGFNFSAVSKELFFTMPLNSGANNVTIVATNTAGQASDEGTIHYKKEVVILPPTVEFINPSSPGTTVNFASYTVNAKVLNIEDVSQIVLQQNGQTINNSAFSYNISTKLLTFNTSLNTGNNSFNINASNQGGANSATTNINYQKPEVICNKPILTFASPEMTNKGSKTGDYRFTVSTMHLTSAGNIKVYLNGNLQSNGTFNTENKIFSQSLSLSEGQNIIEVTAENRCGLTKINRIVEYIVPLAPCLTPEAQITSPKSNSYTTQESAVTFIASVTNVTNASEIKFKVNNVSRRFNYDEATKQVSANVTLINGNNKIEVQVSNNCGSSGVSWSVFKNECQKPKISISNVSAANNSTTYVQSFSLTGIITEIPSSSNITVTHNNALINFVYNENTKTINLDRPLSMGKNTIVIMAKNDCGSSTLTHTVTRATDPNAVPPGIKIVNPGTTPSYSEVGAINVSIETQYVTAANQVAVTVNGVAKNFNFNANNGTITFNLTLADGNVIVATAVTAYGSASDTKTVYYKRPQTTPPPVIVMTNPVNCPATLQNGFNNITGYVTNITSISQVEIKLDGISLSEFNPVLNGGRLTFSVPLSISQRNNAMTLSISATNQGGSDSKSCVLNPPAASKAPTGGKGAVNVVIPSKQEPVVAPTPEIKIPVKTEIKVGRR